MRKKFVSPVNNPLGGPAAASMEVSDHRIETVQAFQPAVPGVAAVAADPTATPPVAAVAAILAIAEVPYKETVNSQLAFYAEDGSQISASRVKLADAAFAAWDNTVVDSDAYFFECHRTARNLPSVV